MTEPGHVSRNAREALLGLFNEAGLMVNRWDLEAVAVYLSALVRKVPPWTRRYLLSIIHETIPPSLLFLEALDRAQNSANHLRSVTPNSHKRLFMPDMKACSICGVKFIPNVPWRSRCPRCYPPGK